MTRPLRNIFLTVCALSAGACGANGEKQYSEAATVGRPNVDLEPQDVGEVADGRRLAEQECATCHAVDRASFSPRPEAPPLRDVLTLYAPDNLADRFIEGMKVGHDGMPQFDFDVRSADALIAYIDTISRSAPRH